jgi:hypothetical protein
MNPIQRFFSTSVRSLLKQTKMKLSDFILLDLDEKKTVALHAGVLIAKRKDFNCMIFLFQLDTFYTEMYCDIKDKSLQEIRVFKETGQLYPYLENIPIEGLL